MHSGMQHLSERGPLVKSKDILLGIISVQRGTVHKDYSEMRDKSLEVPLSMFTAYSAHHAYY